MPTSMKTPGVYIQELNAFGNSFVPVPTAVPAFIGYTKNTSFNGKNLLNQAIKISSLAEFQKIFGNEPPTIKFDVEMTSTDAPDFTYGDDSAAYIVKANGPIFRMHSALKFFYANGGGDCYVLSVGDYNGSPNLSDLKTAVDLLEKETEPTLLVLPDAIELIDNTKTELKDKYADAYKLQSYMIDHCGSMKNRMTILDIPRGFWEPHSKSSESIEAFRENVNPTHPKYNSYAAAYYPWLDTSIYQKSDISNENLSGSAMTQVDALLKMDAAQVSENLKGEVLLMISVLTGKTAGKGAKAPPPEDPELSTEELLQKKIDSRKKANAALLNLGKAYQLVLTSIQQKLNLMPPSAAMAGIYTSVDNNIGVWKAPANISVQSVIAPAVMVDHDMQEDLNVPLSGKSICAIRSFIGIGNIIWGARTLDGNSQDWRYINVRRTMIFLEQSIKLASKAYVFEANDANTWVGLKGMISNFLTGIWKQGGLAGSSPADAFSVSVGLGSTMTSLDILEGIMRVSVKVAVTHPAEFIDITFQQQMQKA